MHPARGQASTTLCRSQGKEPPPQVVVLLLDGCTPRGDHSRGDQESVGKYEYLCTEGAVFRVCASGELRSGGFIKYFRGEPLGEGRNGDTADGATGRKRKDTRRIITYSFETVVGLFHFAMQFSEMLRLLGCFFFFFFPVDPNKQTLSF